MVKYYVLYDPINPIPKEPPRNRGDKTSISWRNPTEGLALDRVEESESIHRYYSKILKRWIDYPVKKDYH